MSLPRVRSRSIRRLAAAVLLAAVAGACNSASDPSEAPETTLVSTGVLEELPPGTRDASGGADPRTAAEWTVWSTCSAESRAAEAAANGGAEAGWPLVDDVLEVRGLGLGEHPILSCGEAVEILATTTTAFDRLGSELLAAEINLNVGAETCEAVDQSAWAAQIALAGVEYGGSGSVEIEPGTATFQLIELLTAYNLGDLCR